jgi:hypothetical protein
MAGVKKKGDFEIGEDLDFQRKEWLFERLGWVVLALLMLAAMLGLFGGGPLDGAQAASPDGLMQVSYARFGRFSAPQTMEITLSPQARQEGHVGVAFHQQFVDKLKIQQTNPEPESVEVHGDWVVYLYQWPEGNSPLNINVYMQAEKTGSLQAELGLAGKPGMSIRQFIYP